MQQKVYPRLERRKLKRITSGKRPLFKSKEEHADFVAVFNTQLESDKFLVINKDGACVRGTLHITSDDSDIRVSVDEFSMLRDAYIDGCCPQVFAQMIEAKAAGVPFKYKRKTSLPPPPVENKIYYGLDTSYATTIKWV